MANINLNKLKIKKNISKNCNDCNSINSLIDDIHNGHRVCTKCGCIAIDRLIDDGKEWRIFDDKGSNDPSRIGTAYSTTLGNEQLDTIISTDGKSFNLSKIQMKTNIKSNQQNSVNMYNSIQNLCDRCNLPQVVVDRAKYIFKDVNEKNVLKGKGTEGMLAAIIFFACRYEGCLRTFKEMSLLTNISKKEIGKCFKIIYPHLKGIKRISYSQVVERFSIDLKISSRVRVTACEIANNIEKEGFFTGRSPDSIAAGILYFTCDFYKLYNIKDSISDVAKVGTSTIRLIFREIAANYLKILPSEIIDAYKNTYS